MCWDPSDIGCYADCADYTCQGTCSSLPCTNACTDECAFGCSKGECRSACSDNCTTTCENECKTGCYGYCNTGCENSTQTNNYNIIHNLQNICKEIDAQALKDFIFYEMSTRRNLSSDVTIADPEVGMKISASWWNALKSYLEQKTGAISNASVQTGNKLIKDANKDAAIDNVISTATTLYNELIQVSGHKSK